jgi:hypothetical protein
MAQRRAWLHHTTSPNLGQTETVMTNLMLAVLVTKTKPYVRKLSNIPHAQVPTTFLTHT